MHMLSTMLVALVGGTHGVLYSINESEYRRMPPLYSLDHYDTCDLYCLLDAELFSEGRPDLLHVIQEYSAYSLKHFNHTQIHRGVCLSDRSNYSNRSTEDIEKVLERQVNDSIWSDYRLQARLLKTRYCTRRGEARPVDAADVLMALVYAVLLVMNIAGTTYDLLLTRKPGHSSVRGNPWLLAFSIQRNWRKLTSSSDAGDPRKRRLRAINGLRSVTLVCVLFSHTVLIMAHAYIDNPLYIEKAYDDPLKQILFNGSLVTQTFFLMSSFLLAYNYQIYSETHAFSWLNYPKGVLNRWLRLTPTYAVILGTISTWLPRAGDGPQWRLVVDSEAAACRQYGWTHLLYVNNYVYENAYCMPQTWYLAADTQLFCAGLLLCTLAWRAGARARRWLLGAALAAALAAPALHTYLQDLDAVVLQSPESYRNLYETDDTFRLVYARGHNNLGAYVIGLASGYLYHALLKEDPTRFKRYRLAYWALFPAGLAVILSGGAFYIDGARAPLAARVLYAALYKPVFTLLVALFMLGAFLKVETVYRGIVEWGGWTWCGRVSYCAFLLHTLLQRALVGAARAPVHMSDYFVWMVLCGSVLLTWVLAGPLCVLVEMPLSHLQRLALASTRAASADAASADVTRTDTQAQSKL